MKKYELTNNTTNHNDKTLYRIKALKDFGDVKAGQLGGYVEAENNLSHEGNCWVYDNVKVYDNARVSGNTQISGDAHVYDDTCVTGYVYVDENAQEQKKPQILYAVQQKNGTDWGHVQAIFDTKEKAENFAKKIPHLDVHIYILEVNKINPLTIFSHMCYKIEQGLSHLCHPNQTEFEFEITSKSKTGAEFFKAEVNLKFKQFDLQLLDSIIKESKRYLDEKEKKLITYNIVIQ